MKEELTTKAGTDALIEMLTRFGLVYTDVGRLTGGGVIVECIAARMSKAVVRTASDATTTHRFQNALEDLCRLGVLKAEQAPQKATAGPSMATEEVKCVKLLEACLNTRWCSITGQDLSEPGGREVIESAYLRWEEDFLLALRLFAHFRQFAPEGWEWPANHITLVWKYAPPDRRDYLLTELVKHAAGFNIPPARAEDFASFCGALNAAHEAYNAILAFAFSSRVPPRRKSSIIALFEKFTSAPAPSIPELLRHYDEKMLNLCSVIGFE